MSCSLVYRKHSRWSRFSALRLFNNPEQADKAWVQPKGGLPDIPSLKGFQLPDRDWVEAYKDHFSPGLTMASIGCRSGSVTTTRCQKEVALYLDPGMAFGTGILRLCVEGLLDFTADLDPQSREGVNIVDAGCGSVSCSLGNLLGFSDFSI